MKDLAAILLSLERRGVGLRARGNKVQFRPPGSLNEAERTWLREHGTDLVPLLDRPTIGQVEIWLGHLDAPELDAQAQPTARCWPCHGTRFFRRGTGPWICARCHPPPVPDDPQLTWFDFMEFPPGSRTPTEGTDA